jgi:chromosome segregation ATPase
MTNMPATGPLLVSLAFVIAFLLSKILRKIRYEKPTIKTGSTDHGVKFTIYSSNEKAIQEVLSDPALLREHMASFAALKDQLAVFNVLLGETVGAQESVESDMKVMVREIQDRIHQLAGRQKALKRVNNAVMKENISLETVKQDSVLASRKLQDDYNRALTAKDATISELGVRTVTLKQRIKSMEQEGWELHNQVRHKAKELHDMTLGWEATKTALKRATDYADEIHSRLDYESQQFEHCASKLQEKELEVESWRKNTVCMLSLGSKFTHLCHTQAGTIRALQSQISDLSCRHCGLAEVQQDSEELVMDMRYMVTVNEESPEQKAQKLQEDLQCVKTHL